MNAWNPFGRSAAAGQPGQAGPGASGQPGSPGDPDAPPVWADGDLEQAAIERDRDLAWELFEVQPTHARIPELAQRVLLREPTFTGMVILLALHRKACGDLDEARRLLRDLLGRQDRQYLSALRILRDLEASDRNHAEALRLADLVLREDPEADWMDRMVRANGLIFTGDPEEGWRCIDDAVALSARTDPERHTRALAQRAARFLSTGAPPERFLPAAEAAIAASPTEPVLSTALAYAYLFDYRAEEAEALLRRVLREDPTDTVAQSGVIIARGFLGPIERGEATMEDLRAGGAGEMAWRMMSEQLFEIGLDDALAALNRVLPRALVRVLRGRLRTGLAKATRGDATLLSWHDGQDPGTGDAWAAEGPARLMSSAEIDAMEDAIERDPAAWPEWSTEGEYFTIIATDDNGAFLFEGTGGRLFERGAGVEDREVAASLADWIWDRIVAFGGEERRPGRA